MNEARKVLESFLAEHGQAWSEEDRALVARIIERGAEITAGLVAEASVERELEQWRSQLASVTAAEAQTVATIVHQSIMSLFARAAKFVVTASGLVA